MTMEQGKGVLWILLCSVGAVKKKEFHGLTLLWSIVIIALNLSMERAIDIVVLCWRYEKKEFHGLT